MKENKRPFYVTIKAARVLITNKIRGIIMLLFLFTKDSHISFTNNRAERDLRMAIVK